jgi:hypothetical protein
MLRKGLTTMAVHRDTVKALKRLAELQPKDVVGRRASMYLVLHELITEALAKEEKKHAAT